MSDGLSGQDRIVVDRLWRDPDMHEAFLKETGVSGIQREEAEYQRLFRIWGKGRLDAGRKESLAATRPGNAPEGNCGR